MFRFEGGTFKDVFRELPRRRTDDIEIVGARNGRAHARLRQGARTVRGQQRSKLRVVWRFAPRADSTNTFVLTYIVRGVVQREAGRDVLAWIALPTEHDYRIDRERSRPRTARGAGRAADRSNRARRLDDRRSSPAAERCSSSRSGIAKNGWLRRAADIR